MTKNGMQIGKVDNPPSGVSTFSVDIYDTTKAEKNWHVVGTTGIGKSFIENKKESHKLQK